MSNFLRAEAAWLEEPESPEIPESYLMERWNMIFGLTGYQAEGCPICAQEVKDMGEDQEGWKIICPSCGEIDIEEHFSESYWNNLNDDF